VLASALTIANYQGPGLSVSDFKDEKIPVLWVHHRNDPCRWTSYSRARDYAKDTNSALVTVTGVKNSRGDACQPFSEHGFVGMEDKKGQSHRRLDTQRSGPRRYRGLSVARFD
jgi:hypothetical protein